MTNKQLKILCYFLYVSFISNETLLHFEDFWEWALKYGNEEEKNDNKL